MDEEFILMVFPRDPSVHQFPINESEFIVGFQADITLLTLTSDDEDARDFECTTQERFLYGKDLKLGRTDMMMDENTCRDKLVNALTEMEALPNKYYTEIVDEVLGFVKNDERFKQCGGVTVDIDLVKYAHYDDDDDAEEEDGSENDVNGDEKDGVEPSFAVVLVDEKMGESQNCVICLDGFAVGVEVYKFECQHVFHKKCLLNWLDRSVTCPLCRKQPPSFYVKRLT